MNVIAPNEELTRRDWVAGLVRDVQVIAGALPHATYGEALLVLRQWVATAEEPHNFFESIVRANLLTDALRRICWARGVEAPRIDSLQRQSKDTLTAVLDKLLAMGRSEEWLRLRLAQLCTRPHVTARMLADELHLSRTQLLRFVHRYEKTTLSDLVNRLRIDVAINLLGNPSLSIKEVAAMAGYSHTSSLDRQFLRLLGMTPSQFRKRDRREPERD